MKLSPLNKGSATWLSTWCVLLFLVAAPAANADSVPGRLLVKLKTPATRSALAAWSVALGELGAKVRHQYSLVPGLVALSLSESKSMEGAAKALSALEAVEYATPSFLRRPSVHGAMPPLPELAAKPKVPPAVPRPTQWVKDPKSQSGVWQNRTQEVWQKYKYYGDPSIIIAVVDTGIDYTHPDLVPNLWRGTENGQEIIGYDASTGDNLPWDDYGHGTHVAGIAAAVGGNGIGVAGQCPRCSVMGVKFITASGEGSDEDAIKALEWAVAHGANVINSSWGGVESSPALEDAFKATAAKGVLNAIAAGNEGQDLTYSSFYPAKYKLPGKVTTAALYEVNVMIPFWSNYGYWDVELSAFGMDVVSLVPGGYDHMSGTSMAAPQVAGLMGFIKGRRPDLSHTQIVELFKHVLPDPSSMGKVHFHGRADAMEIFKRL